MKFDPFSYPKQIYNEGEVLELYRKKFPKIVKEYQNLVKKTYCHPSAYRKEVQKRVKVFDKNLDLIISKYKETKPNFASLIKLDLDLHHNYAFNFWIISYAMNEGPLALHYVKLMENLLKKLYPSKEEFETKKALFLRTDFDIFYHKIMADSVELVECLKRIPEVWTIMQEAKNKSQKQREANFKKIISSLSNLESQNKDAKKAMERLGFYIRQSKHAGSPFLLHNLLNQALDFYQENKKTVDNLEKASQEIDNSLKYSEKKLASIEAKKLKNLYLMIKEMLRAKDSTFGRRDPKLINFWVPLTNKITKLAEREFRIKLRSSGKSFLLIPWALEGKLPQEFKPLFKPRI